MPAKVKVRVTDSWASADRVGTPDYQIEAYRGAQIAAYPLKPNQQFVNFVLMMTDVYVSAWAHVVPRLASGATAHLINPLTGMATPYTGPAGHSALWLSSQWSLDQTVRICCFFGVAGLPFQFVISEFNAVRDVHYSQIVSAFSTDLIDPTASVPYGIDLTVDNISANPVEGLIWLTYVDTLVGTPPFSKTKDVKCKHCGHITKGVPVETVSNKCEECGELTLYFAPKRGRTLI